LRTIQGFAFGGEWAGCADVRRARPGRPPRLLRFIYQMGSPIALFTGTFPALSLSSSRWMRGAP
jgi:hypothetical protein